MRDAFEKIQSSWYRVLSNHIEFYMLASRLYYKAKIVSKNEDQYLFLKVREKCILLPSGITDWGIIPAALSLKTNNRHSLLVYCKCYCSNCKLTLIINVPAQYKVNLKAFVYAKIDFLTCKWDPLLGSISPIRFY